MSEYYHGVWFKTKESKAEYIRGEKKHEAKGEQWHNLRRYGDVKLREWHNAVRYNAGGCCEVCGIGCYAYGRAHHTEDPNFNESVKYDEGFGMWLCIEDHDAVHHIHCYEKRITIRPELQEKIDILRSVFENSKGAKL